MRAAACANYHRKMFIFRQFQNWDFWNLFLKDFSNVWATHGSASPSWKQTKWLDFQKNNIKIDSYFAWNGYGESTNYYRRRNPRFSVRRRVTLIRTSFCGTREERMTHFNILTYSIVPSFHLKAYFVVASSILCFCWKTRRIPHTLLRATTFCRSFYLFLQHLILPVFIRASI